MEISHNNPFVLITDITAKHRKTDKLPIQAWPLAIKDVIDIAGFPTAAGNPTWLHTHSVPQTTASIVTKLVDAGAKIVGKTITDELTYSLDGQNIHYPPLTNSRDCKRICGGSSSGSAIAVATGKARIGLGTDTGGSVRVPASYNGLVGFRPTHGVIDNQGVVALAPQFDTLGWITRTITDTLTVAEVIFDETFDTPLEHPFVLSTMLSICEQPDEIEQTLKQVLSAPLTINSSITKSLLLESAEAFRVLQGREVWQTHGPWITQHQPTFAKDIEARFVWASKLTLAQEKQAKQVQLKLQRLIESMFVDGHYLLFPTTPGPAPWSSFTTKEASDYRELLMAFTCISGLTGTPQVQLPLYAKTNAPTGVSLLGPKGSDLSLIRQAKFLMERYHEI
ncbi:amidase [Aliiglaciecola litoralis]|uniref:Amidase n=1 Tax=Aliiglaciecola litoralis TaxID=582857 RepID=A0ABN1LC03_9ALTE